MSVKQLTDKEQVLIDLKHLRLNGLIEAVEESRIAAERFWSFDSLFKQITSQIDAKSVDRERHIRSTVREVKHATLEVLSQTIGIAVANRIDLKASLKVAEAIRNSCCVLPKFTFSDAVTELDSLVQCLRSKKTTTEASIGIDAFDDWTNDYWAWQDVTQGVDDELRFQFQLFMNTLPSILECLVMEAEAIGIDSTDIISVLGSFNQLRNDTGEFDKAMDAAWVIVQRMKAKRITSAKAASEPNIETPATFATNRNSKYPGLTQAYREAQENPKLAKTEKTYRKVSERYLRTLDKNERPTVAKVQKWLERPSNH